MLKYSPPMFEIILLCHIPHDRAPFPWRNIWRSKVHLRVAFFTWSAVLGKILTLNNLRKQNLIMVDWCCMCKTSGETIDHILLHCEVARALWNTAFGLCGLEWIMHCWEVDLQACWRVQFGSFQSTAMCKMISPYLM